MQVHKCGGANGNAGNPGKVQEEEETKDPTACPKRVHVDTTAHL